MESSLTKAEKAEQVARAAEEAGRKLLYTTDMRLAPFVWRDDRTTAEQLRILLAKHIPGQDKDDRRSKDAPVHPTLSPICAALSGTTTSTCWNTAPRFSRGMLSPSSTALSPRMANW